MTVNPETPTTYTRESIADAISFHAHIYACTRNPAQAEYLSELQAFAVKRYGYSWEEVEALEIAAY